MATLFVYGTLLCPDVATAVLGRAPAVEHARLYGYERVKVRGEHYPGIPGNGNVEGAVWRDVTAAEITVLDAFEGELYTRTLLQVCLMSGEPVHAAGYVFRDAFRHLLTQDAWDVRHFVRYFKDAFLRECL